jgi:hypothetical protein
MDRKTRTLEDHKGAAPGEKISGASAITFYCPASPA